MTNLTPTVTVLNVARAHLWVKEIGDNAGQAVEAILKVCGLPAGNPWCAAFVAYVGRAVFGSYWPLPRVAGCQSLAEAAQVRGLLRDTPAVGDIFLLWSPIHKRFHHTGFVTSIGPAGCGTIEGNTNPGGSPEGTGVFERVRVFAPADRFIRYTEAT